MDESRIPWWLIVLMAITAASLAVWQSSRWKPSVRRGAGCLALVYLALLSYAIGGDPRGILDRPTMASAWQTIDVLLVLAGGLCIVAAVFLLARPVLRGQLTWFTLLSLGSASLCLMTGHGDLACALLLVGMFASFQFVKRWRQGSPFRLAELLPDDKSDPTDEHCYAPWLTGSTGFVLALVLIGTCRYVAHAETNRATASQRSSALPTQGRLHTVLAAHLNGERNVTLSELVFGRRADIVVLVGILTYVLLASTMSEKPSSRG